ncbi:unnamed protein product, partial [Brenthis ino]
MAENNIKMALSPRQTFDGQRVRRISGSAMTIATWNVKSMYRTYKVVNIEREMLRLKINILGVSADIGSDHNPVVASLRCSMKILKPKSKRQQMDVTRLKEPEIRLKTATEINMAVDRLNKELGPNVDVEETWTKLKEKLVDTGKRILQPLKCKIKNRWITEEILSLMEQRRTHKGVDDQQYKYIHKLIQTKVLEAEEKWMVDQCIAIEEFEARYDYFNVHRKVREITGTFKTRNMNCNVLLDDQGNPAKTIEDKLNTWQNYITTLFHDVRPALESSSCGSTIRRMESE